MNTQDLLIHLKSKYPALEFSLEDSTDYKQDGLPEKLISVIDNDMAIVDVYSSSCSRFEVAPFTEYGIQPEDALLLKQHNKVSL